VDLRGLLRECKEWKGPVGGIAGKHCAGLELRSTDLIIAARVTSFVLTGGG